jgi:hypothetical protein
VGITATPATRYTKSKLGGLQMVVLASGSRREMKDFETWLVSRFPGEANHEKGMAGELWPSSDDWEFMHWFTDKHDISIPDLK